jgi:hypothetical protein
VTYIVRRARQGLPLLDVGLTSAATLLLSVAAARSLEVSGFAMLSIVLTVLGLAQVVVQGGLADVVLREHAGRSLEGDRLERLTYVAGGLGLAGLVVSGRFPTAAAVGMGASAAFLLLRQTWLRAELISVGLRARSAALSLVTLSSAAVSVVLSSQDSELAKVASSFFCAYLPAAAVSTLIRRRMESRNPLRCWRLGYATESLVLGGASQIATVLVMLVSAPTFAAGVRGAAILLGPAAVLFSVMRLLLIPLAARRKPSVQFMLLASGSTGGGSLLVLGAAVMVLQVFPGLLGESTLATRAVLALVGASYVAQGVYVGAFCTSRAWYLDQSVRRARLLQLAVLVSGTVVAIAQGSPKVFLYTLVLQFLVASAVLVLGSIPERGRSSVQQEPGRARATS